jgi:hypothetical protein
LELALEEDAILKVIAATLATLVFQVMEAEVED